MSHKYTVEVLTSEVLKEIPGHWTTKDYVNLLDEMEYGDTADLTDEEIKGMALMSLSDLEKDEAAELLLNYVFSEEELNEGQVRNASYEMEDEVLWEEYPDPLLHPGFFRVGSLLYAAFSGGFPKPDARRLKLKVKAATEEGRRALAKPERAFLTRLVAGGLGEGALIHRLFGGELRGDSFPNAPGIIWSGKSSLLPDGVYELTIVSSGYWLKELQAGQIFEANAHPDAMLVV
ncbi:hypothetical protein FUA23_14215 [Neolewinella aurantiaca]|uniref:Uncharacterized protein n=1 Tax=Neolewinella aurantiaca TaxID=2602767 RepID=A0A5C7FG15_9BACT|nr:hypothetical protein [Neolewinella aurantiaca]TXF88617.1 hypothetical protein FUA23_14215 [Neolewinella aurantiaca]